MHGAATSSTLDFTSLFHAATLRIHAMRKASFGVIVTNWHVYNLIPTTGTTLQRHIPLARGRCPKRAIGMAAIIAAVLVSGCARSPSIGVLGAYFPDWLFCIVAGVVLTVVIHLIVKRLQAGHLMGPSAVVYPTLVTFLSLVVWLMLFQH
jgi:hypothetical protein